jgi:hypothetical protein
MQHAIIGGEPADEQPLDAQILQQAMEFGVLEAGIGFLLRTGRLGDDRGSLGQGQVGGESRTLGACHAMHRPGSATFPERAVIRRMPVAGRQDGERTLSKARDVAVEHRRDLVPSRHGQGASGKKIVLDVHDEQGVAG